MTITLLVADDHEVVCDGVASLVDGTEIDIVARSSSGSEAVRLARRRKPDVVLLDIRMADGDGFDALSQIKEALPGVSVLILSTYDNPTYIARALALGASGYVLKGVGRRSLLVAIRKVAAGESAWSREDLRRMTGALSTQGVDIDVPLTKRESEVLRQLALGLTNKEIAKALGIGYETVKEHVQHVLRKLGVSDRTQAAVWAVKRGLV